MNYHIARDGQQLGIFSREDVLARYNRGEIRATDLAWCEGMANWLPVAEVFGAAAAAATPTPAPAPTPPPIGTAPVVPQAAPVSGASSTTTSALPPKPNNYLIPAILVTVLCCLPLGIVSIIFAAQVDGKYSRGDYAGADDSANKAKMWMWIALGAGVLSNLIVFGVMFAGGFAGSFRY